MAAAYADFIKKVYLNTESPKIAVGIDARPTGPTIANAMIKVLLSKGKIGRAHV